MNSYTDQELSQLHDTLYEILGEIIRVCDLLDIPYFIQGGTAIGAFFEDSILPWDDDIDIGMTRANYNRFLKEAPAVLGKQYFLQWYGTDPHTPFYFAKLRKNNTVFLEHNYRNLPIHQGIYIDIFPFDKVPDTPWLQKAQRTISNFFNCCFMGKEVWQWKHCGKCEIDTPTNRGFLPCLLQRTIQTPLSKSAILKILSWTQSCFNWLPKATFYNIVLAPKDHIAVTTIEHPEQRPFGPLTVWAPSDLETYLRRHYRNLRRYIPKEEQMNHRPDELYFSSPS